MGEEMQEVIRTYGEFLLDGMAFFLIIVMFAVVSDTEGHQGILAIIGSKVTLEVKDYTKYKEFRETYQIESSKSAPTIMYLGGRLQVGIHQLSDYIVAKDFRGNSLPIRITSIKNSGGEELLDADYADTTEINFIDTGIYTIQVEAKDTNYKTTRCQILIPVHP